MSVLEMASSAYGRPALSQSTAALLNPTSSSPSPLSVVPSEDINFLASTLIETKLENEEIRWLRHELGEIGFLSFLSTDQKKEISVGVRAKKCNQTRKMHEKESREDHGRLPSSSELFLGMPPKWLDTVDKALERHCDFFECKDYFQQDFLPKSVSRQASPIDSREKFLNWLLETDEGDGEFSCLNDDGPEDDKENSDRDTGQRGKDEVNKQQADQSNQHHIGGLDREPRHCRRKPHRWISAGSVISKRRKQRTGCEGSATSSSDDDRDNEDESGDESDKCAFPDQRNAKCSPRRQRNSNKPHVLAECSTSTTKISPGPSRGNDIRGATMSHNHCSLKSRQQSPIKIKAQRIPLRRMDDFNPTKIDDEGFDFHDTFAFSYLSSVARASLSQGRLPRILTHFLQRKINESKDTKKLQERNSDSGSRGRKDGGERVGGSGDGGSDANAPTRNAQNCGGMYATRKARRSDRHTKLDCSTRTVREASSDLEPASQNAADRSEFCIETRCVRDGNVADYHFRAAKTGRDGSDDVTSTDGQSNGLVSVMRKGDLLEDCSYDDDEDVADEDTFEDEDVFGREVRPDQSQSNRMIVPSDRDSMIRRVEAISDVVFKGFSAKQRRVISHIVEKFVHWKVRLINGFSVLLYGFGSKKLILDTFTYTALQDGHQLVFHGFRSDMRLVDVFCDFLEKVKCEPISRRSLSSLPRIVMEVVQYVRRANETVYLVIHNIDGPVIRDVQKLLAALAKLPQIDSMGIKGLQEIERNFLEEVLGLWKSKDASTMPSWMTGTTGVETEGTKKRRLECIVSSLTKNHKRFLAVIAGLQLERIHDNQPQGIPIRQLRMNGKTSAIVGSMGRLEYLLRELTTHHIVVRERQQGEEVLWIPADQAPEPRPKPVKFVEFIDRIRRDRIVI